MDFYAKIRENKIKSMIMLFVSFVLLLVVAMVIISYISGGVDYLSLASSGAISLIIITTIYFSSTKLALALNKAKEVPLEENPRLHNLVEEMSIAAGVPKPKVYIVQDPALNAFATGRNAKEGHVAFTSGLLEAMNREQLQAITAHELSHIKNEDIKIMTIVAAVSSAIVILADIGARMLWFGGGRRGGNSNSNPIILLLALIAIIVLAPLASAIIQAFISRKRESLADYSAVQLTRNPLGLKRALETLQQGGTVTSKQHGGTAHMWIGNPMKMKKNKRSGKVSLMSRAFATHPPLEERIASMSAMAGETAPQGEVAQ